MATVATREEMHMKYIAVCFFIVCATQCFANELIVRYYDSTFFYMTMDDKRTDFDLNLKTFGNALENAYKGNKTLWRSLDANTLVLHADLYDDMTMSTEHYILKIPCRGMFHVTIDRVLHNGTELFGYARDAVVMRLLEYASTKKNALATAQDYKFIEFTPKDVN